MEIKPQTRIIFTHTHLRAFAGQKKPPVGGGQIYRNGDTLRDTWPQMTREENLSTCLKGAEARGLEPLTFGSGLSYSEIIGFFGPNCTI